MATNEQIVDALIKDCTNQLKAGTLLKNVRRGLINIGISEFLAEKILRIAELNHNDESAYVAK